MENILTPNFRQIAIKGKNKTFFRADALGEFVMFFEGDMLQTTLRNKVSQIIYELLNDYSISHHFVRANGQKEQVVSALEMIPFVLNISAYTTQSIVQQLRCSSGMRLKTYLIEMNLKNFDMAFVSAEHVIAFEWITRQDWEFINETARRVMDIISAYFKAYDATVTNIKLEFGRSYKNGKVQGMVIGDELNFRNIEFFINNAPSLNPSDILQKEQLHREMAIRFGILDK